MRALRLTSLISCIVVLGLTLCHVLQAPGTLGLDGAGWLRVQHTFYGGFAVVGGLAEVIGLVSACAAAVTLRRRRRVAVSHAVAAACLAGTLLAYWFGNRPVNARIARWTPATLPSDWSAYRSTWETAHAISFALAVIATAALLASAFFWSPAPQTSRSPAVSPAHG